MTVKAAVNVQTALETKSRWAGHLDLDSLESKESPLWHHRAGLSYTSTGYGSKIPTTRMVRLPGEKAWRRVYCAIYGNIGTCYVVKSGERIVVR